MDTFVLANAMLFLSTLSLRRATPKHPKSISCKLNFYPRSPCGERPYHFTTRMRIIKISIHALLAESDQPSTQGKPTVKGISIHALLAESDYKRCELDRDNRISIHALLAESDLFSGGDWVAVRVISIHALLAESDKMKFDRAAGRITFLSTLSLRRATR